MSKINIIEPIDNIVIFKGKKDKASKLFLRYLKDNNIYFQFVSNFSKYNKKDLTKLADYFSYCKQPSNYIISSFCWTNFSGIDWVSYHVVWLRYCLNKKLTY